MGASYGRLNYLNHYEVATKSKDLYINQDI